jgi:prepilin-type processing-associated H-X9-DG protein
LSCQNNVGASRPLWISGNLDFNPGNRSNWDVNQDIANSPLWPYIQGKAGLFRCPGDRSSLMVSGTRMPRVRSYSMSQVFGTGDWLSNPYPPQPNVWRIYSELDQIVFPSKTFVFIEEHPDSINDGAFANQCTGAQPQDPPSAAMIIDWPASLHDELCNLSFADGHLEAYRWKGTKIRNAPISYNGNISVNVPAGDSWIDIQWLAAHTTVRR